MDDSFFSFDDPPVARITSSLKKPATYIDDPRDMGGLLLQSKAIDRASCSLCDASLHLDVFYFEDGNTRKFVRCEGCGKYLFSIEKKMRF